MFAVFLQWLGYDEIVDALITHGASINFRNKFGRTALSKAIDGGPF